MKTTHKIASLTIFLLALLISGCENAEVQKPQSPVSKQEQVTTQNAVFRAIVFIWLVFFHCQIKYNKIINEKSSYIPKLLLVYYIIYLPLYLLYLVYLHVSPLVLPPSSEIMKKQN